MGDAAAVEVGDAAEQLGHHAAELELAEACRLVVSCEVAAAAELHHHVQGARGVGRDAIEVHDARVPQLRQHRGLFKKKHVWVIISTCLRLVEPNEVVCEK